MEREIVLDTETTGLDPHKGKHRLVEIGCVELRNRIPTGRKFQIYINPERDMPEPAFAVHGLSEAFLKQFAPFAQVASEFLDFIEDLPLVIHNAGFDMKFLQAELEWAGLPILSNPVVDTLVLARQKFPGAPASLDMLCRRFQINNTHREKHGALLDAEILAQVYLELSGGLQPHLSLFDGDKNSLNPSAAVESISASVAARVRRPPRSFSPTEEELRHHQALVDVLGASAWTQEAS